jgi:hypothetical protein
VYACTASDFLSPFPISTAMRRYLEVTGFLQAMQMRALNSRILAFPGGIVIDEFHVLDYCYHCNLSSQCWAPTHLRSESSPKITISQLYLISSHLISVIIFENGPLT